MGRLGRTALRGALLGVVLLAAACGEDGGEGPQATGTTVTTAPAAGSGQDRFCDLLAQTDGEVAESYLGSAEHLVALDGLVAAAPAGVLPDVEAYRDHVRTSVRPADPGSADVAGWPAPVNAAIGRIQEHRSAHC